ncbi:ATP-dependent DNA helicase [Nigerium massiliense]|uniref:ATP-dependent DNA helicase n=1 Tax=Nigerium massiliense TaxID=1522317 RepID=UPI00059091A9|nr:ATP-dependent DNA helicase [Nigerium massiliense]
MSRHLLRFPRDVSEALGIDFSEQQLRAITAPLEPGVIIAGAGSGKTTVMAARVVWLVGTGAVRPEQVLGLTFTRKAAAELSSRVRTALLRAGALDLEGLDDAGEQLIMTYDAFAARLVADHGLRLGIEGDARMITGAARFRLASRVVTAAPGPFEHLARLRPDSVTERVLRLDADLQSHLAGTDAVRAQSEEFVREVESSPRNRTKQIYASLKIAEAKAREREELTGLVEEYQRLKRARGSVEFADQMAIAARLAQAVPEVSRALREQFAVVLLDEYQDTSSAQAELLRALFSGETVQDGRGHPVTAVGDPCQAIYGWRGAAASNIITFADSFPLAGGEPARGYALTVNRRSGQTILDAANVLAAPLRDDPDLAWDGIDQNLVAPEGTPPGDIVTASFDTWPGEVTWVADRLVASHAEGQVRRWSDIAVLCRRNANIRGVYAELTERDVPVEIVGLDGLMQVPEVADVVATLRVLGDMTANPDLVRLLTGPRWALGPGDLAALGRRAAELAEVERPTGEDFAGDVAATLAQAESTSVVSLAEALENPGEGPYTAAGTERLRGCAAELRMLRRYVGEPVTDLVRRVISASGVEVELGLRGPDGARQLNAFVAAVSAYTDVDGDGSLAGLLAYLAAEEEHGVGLEQAVVSDENSVKLLTIHRAKGLEWELVFLPALADGVFPSDRVTDNWLKNAGVIPADLRGDAASVPQLADVTDAATKDYARQLKDENRRGDDRLAYVAVTRARQHLVASTHTWYPGLSRPRLESPYLRVLSEVGERVHADEISAANPLDGGAARVPWPLLLDEEARGRRLAVAEQVERARAKARSAGRYPDDRVATLDDAGRLAEWDHAFDQLVPEAKALRGRPGGFALPRYLSTTALMQLDADPDAYAAAIRRPMPQRPSRGSRAGEEFHAWLQRRFEASPSLWEAEDEPDPVDGQVTALIRRFKAGRFADRVPDEVEVPFALFLGGQVIRGRIDAVYSDGGRIEVVDWKTGAAHRANPLQLAVYRLAWAELAGLDPEQVGAVFYDVVHDRVIEPENLPGRAQLESLAAGLLSGQSGDGHTG